MAVCKVAERKIIDKVKEKLTVVRTWESIGSDGGLINDARFVACEVVEEFDSQDLDSSRTNPVNRKS